MNKGFGLPKWKVFKAMYILQYQNLLVYLIIWLNLPPELRTHGLLNKPDQPQE